LEKITCFFKKLAKIIAYTKNAKISTLNLNLKVKNIYTKPLLNLCNAYNKPCFETVDLGENIKDLHKQNVAQNVANMLGYFIFFKNYNELPKVFYKTRQLTEDIFSLTIV
jgi:hypothetical protein